MNYVLFLDDEVSILSTYQRMLRNYNIKGLYARNSIEAQEIIEQYKIDLIISDYRLEQETGLDFLKHIRNVNKDVPMIIISGFAEENYIKFAMETEVIQAFIS